MQDNAGQCRTMQDNAGQCRTIAFVMAVVSYMIPLFRNKDKKIELWKNSHSKCSKRGKKIWGDSCPFRVFH